MAPFPRKDIRNEHLFFLPSGRTSRSNLAKKETQSNKVLHDFLLKEIDKI
jgi:hypothetical protein